MIGVLLCTYNGENYIYDQLESLLKQKRKADEVLIVDDNSNDKTVDICKKFILKNNLNKTWRLIINQNNIGRKINFFKNIELLNSDYIFFCDQDDVWSDEKIFQLTKMLEKDENIVVAACYESLIRNGKLYPAKMTGKDGFISGSEIPLKIIYHNFSGSCICFKKEFYLRVRKYRNENWAHDNFFWWFSFFCNGLVILNKSLVQHRITGVNASRRKMYREDRINFCNSNLQNLKLIKSLILKDENDSTKKMFLKIIFKLEKGLSARKKLLDSRFAFLYLWIPLIFKYNFIYANFKNFLGDIKSIFEDFIYKNAK